MIISPFAMLATIYFFANFISLLFGIADGGMLLEGNFFELSSESMIWAFLVQQCFVVLLWLMYRVFFAHRTVGVKLLGNGYGAFLLLSQLAFLFYNQIMGVNVAGVESHGGGAVDYLFVLVQPDVLFVLIGLGLRSPKWFWLNCAVFLGSMFLRGWMGGVLVALVLILCRGYPIRLSLKALRRAGVAIIMVVLILPVVIEAKWAMRSGVSVSEFFNSLTSVGLDSYGEAVRYVMNRLQHVGHVALILENADHLNAEYLRGSFIPYWADGLPQMTVYKILGIEYFRLNTFLVNDLLGYPDVYWNTNPGLAGWAFLLKERVVMLVLFLVLLLGVVYGALRSFIGSRYVMLIACFSLVYLYHGWIGSFFNLCFYAIVLMLVVRVRILPRARTIAHVESWPSESGGNQK